MESHGTRLFRILLEVDGIERSVAFYSTILADPGRRIHGGRHYFDCGEVILGFVDVGPSAREARRTSEYIYFAVADLDAAHERAATLGCLSDEDVHGESAGAIVVRPWGERSFYVVDPFGNRLCFVDETTLYTGR